MLRSVEMSKDGGDRRAWWLATCVWAAAIFVASSIPSAGSSGGVTLRGSVLHLVSFGVLAALLRRCGLSWWQAVVATVLYGLTDELHQALVPGRDASAADLAFDALGAMLGASLVGIRRAGR